MLILNDAFSGRSHQRNPTRQGRQGRVPEKHSAACGGRLSSPAPGDVARESPSHVAPSVWNYYYQILIQP